MAEQTYRDKSPYWSMFCDIQRYSFILGDNEPRVVCVNNDYGNWVEQSAVSELVDHMQEKIHEQNKEIQALKKRLELKVAV